MKSWSGHSSSLEKLLWSKIELKCWIVIEMCWKRKLGYRLSPEIDAILWPSSEKKVIDDWFNGPSVSAAIGLNRWPVCAKRLYLAVFWPAACSAAAPPNFIIYYILLYFIYSLSIIFYLFDQLNVILDHRAEQLFYWRFVCSFTYLTTNYHKTRFIPVFILVTAVCVVVCSQRSRWQPLLGIVSPTQPPGVLLLSTMRELSLIRQWMQSVYSGRSVLLSQRHVCLCHELHASPFQCQHVP